MCAMAASFPTNQAIVVGGGLGGMSAANTVVENGGRVILLATWLAAMEGRRWETLAWLSHESKILNLPI